MLQFCKFKFQFFWSISDFNRERVLKYMYIHGMVMKVIESHFKILSQHSHLEREHLLIHPDEANPRKKNDTN
jgi:hypothetical protein